MQTSSKAKHLGTLITERGNPAEEIRRRVTATMPVLRHLDISGIFLRNFVSVTGLGFAHGMTRCVPRPTRP